MGPRSDNRAPRRIINHVDYNRGGAKFLFEEDSQVCHDDAGAGEDFGFRRQYPVFLSRISGADR